MPAETINSTGSQLWLKRILRPLASTRAHRTLHNQPSRGLPLGGFT